MWNCLDTCILSQTMKRKDRGGRFRLRSNSDDDNELKPDREYDNNCVFKAVPARNVDLSKIGKRMRDTLSPLPLKSLYS